ncbi:unnamed protein product [Spirodela intermedia]|uniref:MINDY deubiquitinase domain-containing protein n=1 Tax=Spirodela intermedia TaxID=51605 RepID=A0A7I8K637_SPIIN|nr:unnamed protein product [Spirodela intermedia]
MSEAERKATPEEDERQIGKDVGGDVSVGGEAETVDDEEVTAIFYKTKVVEFLGRSSQIILQNDNGPCPLLAICNVLLLRNVIDLSLDISEVSQQKLLSLVAERLLDSNSNLEGKDEDYVSNQQRNISDAIDLLPCLARGIDVNVLFRKIDDFEFTPECAIFDLLDIGLYHGWIVDPQDMETANAIGSKSYNALVGELVALDTRSPKEDKYLPEDDSVDFAAAATAALGVPSPCLSRSLSCNDPQILVLGHLIRNFLKDNASQLTVYGLFCLQEGLKERELCVFFRNNHFSTMFKYNEELYLLATDQGYISQQNLVWEKLNEVNGDTMFMRSDFKQFMPEVQVNHSWDEQNGMNEFLAVEGSTSGNSTFKIFEVMIMAICLNNLRISAVALDGGTRVSSPLELLIDYLVLITN